MQEIDYLIVTDNATRGQNIYTNQRKVMLEDLGYSVKIIKFNSPLVRIYFDLFRVGYIYKKNLEKYLKIFKPQIIEFYCPATLILQDKKLLERFKIIASFDVPFGINFTQFGAGILHRLERQKLYNADLIISLTKYGENFLRSKYMIKKKVVHMPYILNPKELEEINVFDAGFVISYSTKGRFNRKGFDILIKAWSRLNTERKLIITGTDERSAIRYLIGKGIVLPKNIEFMPFLPRKEYLSLLSHCSFFISPCRFEEFGQATIEALSLGKPVVSTPTLGPSELLYGFDKKLISPTFSPSDLAKTIEYLEENLSSLFIKESLNRFIKTYNYNLLKNRLNDEVATLLAGENKYYRN